MIVTKLDIRYDVERMWQICHWIINRSDDPGPIDLMDRPAMLNDLSRGTLIEEIVHAVPYRLERLYIMRLKGRGCFAVHRDLRRRLHLPLVTNPQVLMVFPEEPAVVHLPADGFVYLVDSRRLHTTLNGSLDERIHLVGALIDEDFITDGDKTSGC